MFISDLYLDPFNDTSAWAGPSNSRPTSDVGSYAAPTGSSEEDWMDLDESSIQLATYSDSESTILTTKSYSEKRMHFGAIRAASMIMMMTTMTTVTLFKVFESVQLDLQPSLPADDKVGEVQCKRNAEGDDSTDGYRRTS